MANGKKLKTVIVGGGMITGMQILPTIYHLQRLGVVDDDLTICALNAAPLKTLAEDAGLLKAFPGQGFTPSPDFAKGDLETPHPDLYKEAIAALPPRNLVVVAVPDQLHYGVLKVALEHDQHVCCVKPLVLKHAEALEIEQIAHDKGLVIGIEYHKRFDDRALMARRSYREGRFGEFRMGQAHLHECWYYRHSNFQNWCTCENSDMFTYIGCHYVDLVHFITGLKPASVSVYGAVEKYPNGNEGYLWTDGRVVWENGAVLSVQNCLGHPNDAAGGNSQGMHIYGQGDDIGTMIFHSDQYRGLKHSFTKAGTDPGDTVYTEPSPDYFKLIDLGGEGLVPIGYGYRSIAYIINAAKQAEDACAGLDEKAALAKRQEIVDVYDAQGIMATPKNSSYNELVMEAGRLSILNGSREVEITYGEHAGVKFKEF